ncbi:MAG: AEC family transporter [Rhodobacterales bacterium]|nr:AEC family transporter [Pseudomonadota bacterium]MDA1285028.1 AEC family transporter [Pseudomonadota bacterium]
MLPIFLKTLPFFAILGLGYLAARRGFFSEQATAHLTKFVFYFALSAMLFRFAATLDMAQVFDTQAVFAYLTATLSVYLLATAVALWRKTGLEQAAIEAQCAAIGNVGFLGIPMLALLMGPQAIGPVMIVLGTDLIVFGSLIVILISASRDGRMNLAVLGPIALGLVKNPMVMAMTLGLIWSSLSLPLPTPATEFLTLLGAAATPGALFAIGASLASKSAERKSVALWLSTAKLALHPLAVTFAATQIFTVPPFTAAVMIAAAAMPTAGNVYILAQHYGIAPLRVSSTILISTAASVLTLTYVISLVSG